MHAAAPEEKKLVEVDPVRAVRLVREQLAGRRPGELARGGPVLRLDDPVGDERAEERERRAASPRDGEVVERTPLWTARPSSGRTAASANAAVAPTRPRQVPAATSGTSTSRRSTCAAGADEDEERHARPEHRSDPPVGRSSARATPSATSENAGREDGVARELVEEEHVPGVEEERRRGRDRGGRPEAPRDRAPREDRQA